MKMHVLILLAAVSVMLSGCLGNASDNAFESVMPETDPILSYIAQMSLEEKIGQLFIVRPESFYSESESEEVNAQNKNGLIVWTERSSELLKQYPVGGIILFGQNIIDPDQLNTLMDALHHTDGIPLFLCVDEEGGRVARIGNTPGFDVKRYSSMLDVGQSYNWDEGYSAGHTIGSYLFEYGFNVDFAPDADVFSNPNNKAIGDRSFSRNPAAAANMVNAAVTGFHDAGMMTCLKHFPGHGDTDQDTHNGYASSRKTWGEMMQCEMRPFISGIQAGSDFVMASHITVPNASDDGLPTSLSREMLTDRLRKELGFTGIIITDAMDMKAITRYYSSAEASITAFNAGADMILIPHNLPEAFQGMLEAVNNGTISEERLTESLHRIISAKLKYGILKQ
ncbi:MAG: glycoside hydrolase family 3 protein [Erysipelotrichia bacterium]|nr:glycoside hydrolase family 3 protein [Erysipelotrichia bacterium]